MMSGELTYDERMYNNDTTRNNLLSEDCLCYLCFTSNANDYTSYQLAYR